MPAAVVPVCSFTSRYVTLRVARDVPVKKLTVLLLVVLALPLLPHAAEPRLMDAVRAGDTATLTRLLAAGADANATDDTGATALMYATAYGSPADMTALIDAGARVNATNAFQSTALHWAAGDAVKLTLLLDRGANPDARAADRTNALLAAVRHGNPEAVKLLLRRVADPKATPSDIARLLSTAYILGSPAIRRVLAEHGIEMKQPAQLGAPFVVLNLADAATVKQLLDLGSAPHEEIQIATLTLPALALAAGDGHLETARLLVDRGADPSKGGTHGYTPLMMAASAPRPSLPMIQFLLDKKADLAARDDAGRSALDWAQSAGDAAAVALLKGAGAPSTAPPLSQPAAVARPREARDAVTRAIARLQPISPPFHQQNKCISCHNQSLPAMAVKVARDRQIPFDRALASHPSQASLESWKAIREQVMLGNGEGAIGGFAANLSYGLSAMADEGAAPNAITDAMAHGLALSQRANGSFTVEGPGNFRSPLGSRTEYSVTAFSIKALTAYAPPARAADTRARLERALAFVRSEEPTQTQDYVFKLLALAWSKAPAAEREIVARQLAALQRADGGWGQVPGLSPDAFATGQALYALHASGMAATTDVYRKGADYLRRTQLEDGSWFVRSRAFGFQPYFDTGFPHGKDQFISAAATSWAAIALAYTL